ncbi:MAG: hypothetical protein L6V93_07855 [Clostridiales bacterium]|nr:MAG: hypothetical protein L6V93_07855 [Clostridiales bacterium]
MQSFRGFTKKVLSPTPEQTRSILQRRNRTKLKIIGEVRKKSATPLNLSLKTIFDDKKNRVALCPHSDF